MLRKIPYIKAEKKAATGGAHQFFTVSVEMLDVDDARQWGLPKYLSKGSLYGFTSEDADRFIELVESITLDVDIKKVQFVLNGAIMETDEDTLSYERIRDILKLTGTPTCTVRSKNRDRCLLPGGVVAMDNGVIIDMIHTGNA